MEIRDLHDFGDFCIFSTTYDGTDIDCWYDVPSGVLKISKWQSEVGKGRDYKTATETVKREFERTMNKAA